MQISTAIIIIIHVWSASGDDCRLDDWWSILTMSTGSYRLLYSGYHYLGVKVAGAQS
jgi:hypothetical protein